MGRRWPFAGTMLVAGVACLMTIPVPPIIEWLNTTLAMFGKLSVSASNIIMPVFTAELYPTTIRNIGVGASNVSAGLALIMVPYLWELAKTYEHLPMIVLGSFMILGGVCILFLPETGHGPLKDKLTEEKNITVNNLFPRVSVISGSSVRNAVSV